MEGSGAFNTGQAYSLEGANMTPTTEYREIPLTQGQAAIVDAADYDWLNHWSWHAMWCKNTRSYYAVRWAIVDGKRKMVLMHRQILGLQFGDKRQGDHKQSGMTLLNVRSNLRIATRNENQRNQRLSRANTSGLKGACWDKRRGLWLASIGVNGKHIFLGYFGTPEEAHEAYKQGSQRYHGEFSRTQ